MSTANVSPDSSLPNEQGEKKTGFNPGFDLEKFQKELDDNSSPADEPSSKKSNPFPVDVFPWQVQEIILATNVCLNYPFDFIGASILFAASLSIGNTRKVRVKKGWVESAMVFMANVGRPGTVKTHPQAFALKPIQDRQAEMFRAFETQLMEFDRINKLSKDERKQQKLEDPIKPHLGKFTVSDFTPEALAEVHKHNMRGIGVHADELASWFKNFNRYHQGGEAEIWLSIWSCSPIDIVRKNSDPLLIRTPFISVCGNIQPAVLEGLGGANRSQNGFIDRILFAYPETLKKPYWSDEELPTSII